MLRKKSKEKNGMIHLNCERHIKSVFEWKKACSSMKNLTWQKLLFVGLGEGK